MMANNQKVNPTLHGSMGLCVIDMIDPKTKQAVPKTIKFTNQVAIQQMDQTVDPLIPLMDLINKGGFRIEFTEKRKRLIHNKTGYIINVFLKNNLPYIRAKIKSYDWKNHLPFTKSKQKSKSSDTNLQHVWQDPPKSLHNGRNLQTGKVVHINRISIANHDPIVNDTGTTPQSNNMEQTLPTPMYNHELVHEFSHKETTIHAIKQPSQEHKNSGTINLTTPSLNVFTTFGYVKKAKLIRI